MPTQDKVFEAIKSERDYQDRLWGPTETKGIHSVAEFVLFIEDYVAEARSQLSRNAGHQADEDALNTLRKVAALCVSAMDGYHTPPWPAICEAVACLRIERREGVVVPLRREQ